MKDLLSLALSATKENVTTRKTKKSVNDALFEILFTNKQKKTKTELIAMISLDRLQDAHDGELDAKTFQSEEVQEQFKAINRTVKNGFEASVCNGKTSASFSANKRFKDYTLSQDANGQWSITEK